MWEALRKAGRIEANLGQQCSTAAGALFAWTALRFQNKANVALDIKVRKQPSLLDDITHSPAQTYDTGIHNICPVHPNLAARRLDHAIDGAQKRGLSGTASAKDGSNRSFLEGE